ncbi:transcriptional repressor LexA [Alkaliphilus peptidifermentans]|uniref:LexA repressor n=1 Tax=Alkaliphilus peptidifermentans DSM 18978 TaxID=1120976 RepID=A0A1G5KKX3_9FIRM|nr:transcriptional repressor LexA [Alkaliphilus peptidifermentans]SCZ01024.1 SOS-response transcriptional repressor, LexA [Alkaliphilus peptidifermentans DSM 18978]
MYEDLSSKQVEILKYMKSQINQKGYPPSVREICEAVALRSTSTVHGHLSKLETKGYIRRDATKPRAIEILTDDHNEDYSYHKEMVNIPIIGKVTAGEPILAVENIEDSFPMPLDFVGHENHKLFMLTIRGDSMIEAGIMDNDYVIVRQQPVATNGDIVVALMEDGATVKRFYREKDYIRLQPENSSMEPIIVKDVSILGKVVGVFRKIQ